MTTLIASSVVQGSHQGESHGGVFLIDFEHQSVQQVIDWDTTDIDWRGRGWDRGLRGIAFDGERVFIAASNELFVYTPDFTLLASYRNPFLMHCHEIFAYQRRLYLTSTGFDAVLGFDLDSNRFCFGLHLVAVGSGYQGAPLTWVRAGSAAGNQLHLNNVFCDGSGMYLSGLKTAGMLRFDGRTLVRVATLPRAFTMPDRIVTVFCSTIHPQTGCACSPRAGTSASPFPPSTSRLTHTDLDDSRIARGFGRGLCVLDEHLVAAGSSPSTIAPLHDLEQVKTVSVVNLSWDVRNAIHGLELWPFA